MKNIISIMMFIFAVAIPVMSHAGNICFDDNGFYCAHFSNLDREWLAMSHTDSFTDRKNVALIKFENGSHRLWQRRGERSFGKRVFMNIECDNKGKIIKTLFWSQDIINSGIGKKLQFLAMIGAMGAGTFGGPEFARKGKGFENAKEQMERMEIDIQYRFDSEVAITNKWHIHGEMPSRNMFNIYSNIPYSVLDKIASGKYQKLAIRGNFLSTQRTAFFDLSESKSAFEKLYLNCPEMK